MNDGLQRIAKEIEKIKQELGESKTNLKKAEDRIRDLHDMYKEIVRALIIAIDEKDHYTHNHSENVARYTIIISKKIELDEDEIQTLKEACQLHDLGKIGVSDYILTKVGKLSPEEWKEMRSHPLKGAQILEPLEFLNGISRLVRQHHERFDGDGYPDGLRGENISLGARIMAVADAFDAMSTRRPYRRALTRKQIIDELKRNAGTQFDPEIANAFLEILLKSNSV